MKKLLLLITAILAGAAVNAQTIETYADLYKYDFDTYEYTYYGGMKTPVSYDAATETYSFPGFLGFTDADKALTVQVGELDDNGYPTPEFGGDINIVTPEGFDSYFNMGNDISGELVNEDNGDIYTISNNQMFFTPYSFIYPGEGEFNDEIYLSTYSNVNKVEDGVSTPVTADYFYLMIGLPEPEEFAAIKNVGEDAVDANAPFEYFNLQGIKVANPAEGQVYIRRQGRKVAKVML